MCYKRKWENIVACVSVKINWIRPSFNLVFVVYFSDRIYSILRYHIVFALSLLRTLGIVLSEDVFANNNDFIAIVLSCRHIRQTASIKLVRHPLFYLVTDWNNAVVEKSISIGNLMTDRNFSKKLFEFWKILENFGKNGSVGAFVYGILLVCGAVQGIKNGLRNCFT